jgi:serine/threonine protein kinase/type II secretory pathway pseudopilin PulG
MQMDGKAAEEVSSPSCQRETITPISAPNGSLIASNSSASTHPSANSETTQHSPPGDDVRADENNESRNSETTEEEGVPEKVGQRAVIIVEDEPALIHERNAHHTYGGEQEQPDAVYAWSPATPDFAELIPIGTTQSQRESVVTHETEGSPRSLYESPNGSPRAVAASSPSRVRTAPGESVLTASIARNALSLQSSICTNSLATESMRCTPLTTVLWQRAARNGEAKDDNATSFSDTLDTDPVKPLHTSAPLPPPSSDFHRCTTAAPMCLRGPALQQERSPSPSATPRSATSEAPEAVVQAAKKPPTVNLHVEVSNGDTDSPAPPSAPLCLSPTVTKATAKKTNASGGTVPNVPAIRLPVALVSPGAESDRSFSVLGYGPRSAPNACSLASARSGRSSRSARHSHRCCASMHNALPSLKELFPTLPAEMYLARERLRVAQDSNGRLGTGAYGTVQRAELYPPEVEVPRFFTSVTETFTNASNPDTPRYSPATAHLPIHDFASIASMVGGACGGGAGTTPTGAHGKEHSNVFLHSRLESVLSMDSVSTLPLHQQPYNDQTASFYNGLDDVPGLMRAESLHDSRSPARGQSPEAEPVVLCSGPLAVRTDSEEISAPVTLNTKGLQGSKKSAMTPIPVELQECQTATPLNSVNSRCVSQKFPSLPAMLAMKVKEGDVGGSSLTSPQVSVTKLAADELDAEAEDNTVRMSAGDTEVRAMLTGPLRDLGARMDGELSLASTAGTHQITSLGSPRWNDKTFCHNTYTPCSSNVYHLGGEVVADEEYPASRIDNSTTLPTQMLFEGDGTAVSMVGDEAKGLYKGTSRHTTKVQALEIPVSGSTSKDSGTTSLAEVETVVVDATRARLSADEMAVLRPPLVLPHRKLASMPSISCATGSSSPTSSSRRDASVVAAADSGEKTSVAVAAQPVDIPASKLRQAAERDCKGDYKAHRTNSIFFPDAQEAAFLATLAVPKLQASRTQVGDETLTSTALQTVARAVREAREEFEDAIPPCRSDLQRDCSEGKGLDDTEAPTDGRGEKDVDGDPADLVRKASQEAPCDGNTPTPASATTPGFVSTGSKVGGDWKHVEKISPTSTVSSMFSGGVTNLNTTCTSKQGSIGITPQATITTATTTMNSLHFPSNGVQTPLVRYGVSSTMVSEAVSNGCAPFRPVATKIVEKSDLADSAIKLNAFHNELRMASRLNHPCLVNMFGVAEDVENFYLVMDLAEKGNVAQYQKAFGVRDTRIMAPRFLADVVLALEYLRDGSQHTYWMTTTRATAKTNSNSNDDDHRHSAAGERKDDDEADNGELDGSPGSTSTVSLRPTADASSATTPKVPTVSQPALGASLKCPAEVGDDCEGDRAAAAATATERDGKKGGGRPGSARCATRNEQDETLMRESIVLHRDIKPDNLLLTWDFHVKLADFGDACFYGDEEANSFGGTPSYISPEVIQTSKAGPYSDLWAMGCILYELLVGEKLFTGSLREVADKIQSFSSEDMVFPTTAAKAADDIAGSDDDDGDSEESEGAAADTQWRNGGSRSNRSGITITQAAKDLVRQLLRHAPEERIGSAERGGFATLKDHPFFAEIDWSSVLETTNITTTNTDYTAELADYLEPGESLVYCSPVKVLPTSESHGRSSRPTHLSAQGALVMVLTDTPRLFLVNPDTDTIQSWIPWSPELRVGVLRADRFAITVPISDILTSPSTPGTAFSGGASMSTASRTSTATTSTITYTFYDTTRRADLWGVKIHHLQSVCRPPARRDGGWTPTFPFRQSSTTQAAVVNGLPPLHWPPPPPSTRRGTPTLSPRAGGCLLHRLRTTPRSARAGSLSNYTVSLPDAVIATPRDVRSSATMTNAGSFTEVSAHSGPGTAAAVSPPAVPNAGAAAGAGAPVAAAKSKPITRYSQPIQLPATFLEAATATATATSAPSQVATAKSVTTLTSPVGVSSAGSSPGLYSPEAFPAPYILTPAVVAPIHSRASTMTVTVASSSHQIPSPASCRGARPSSLSSTVLSPVDFGATMRDGWVLTAARTEETEKPSTDVCGSNGATPKAAHPDTCISPGWNATATNMAAATLAGSADGGGVCGDPLGHVMLGCSGSGGDATPCTARAGDGEDGMRAFVRDTPTPSEATPGPSSARRQWGLEPETEYSSTSQASARYESDGWRGLDTPVKALPLASAMVTAPPKEKLSKVRQQYKKTQRKRTKA